ncbi:phytanoyl-CoA dioxygenase domain-containing protein 1-like [Centruroides vittatus]|uniref:phytanoyl-CoA dioxygenase domain-containing protein 1-like n=1 Tax=Centruroides vittatus TaxID=120091 RepID=UPI00350E916B
MVNPEDVKKYYDEGFLVIPNFLTLQEVDLLKSECTKVIEKMNPSDTSVIHVGSYERGDEYYMESASKIHFFFEADSVDDEGELIIPKEDAVEKVAHALHLCNDVFKKFTFSRKVKDLLKKLGFVDPVVTQSMYIFKHPRIGAEVIPHQDATFLHTVPDSNLVGLWFPIEDATLQNGCLHFVPGSHKGEVYKRYVRNFDGTNSMKTVLTPPNYTDEDWVPAIAPKGSCVLIHGKVFHKSEKNLSTKPRPAYTFHIVENYNTVYSKENWVQPPPDSSFVSVYDTEVE